MAGNVPPDDQMFSQLVEGITTKAQTDTKCEFSDMLRDVIRTHINTWLGQVEDINPLYKVTELIPVGSYAEGTKILQPDEFDYLAVIEEFSKPGTIAIDAVESNIQRGLVKVIVEDEELKSKCKWLCKDGHLKCFQTINFPALEEARFGHVLIQNLKKVVKSSKKLRRFSYETPTHIDCLIQLPTLQSIPLLFKGAQFRAPNVLLNFKYKTMEVTVDVSPAIRYHNIHDCFREKDCAGPAFAELVLSRESLLLVGTSTDSDFKVTVTEAEVEYIQRVMKPEHKIIYIFLKYIVKLFNELGGLSFPFSSYMMKTICIHHDIKCEKDERSIKECFKSVIDDMNICKHPKRVVSIVNKNILLGPIFSTYEWDRECLLQGIEKIFQLPIDITTVEDFDAFLQTIVQEQHQKRSDEDMERRKEQMEASEKFQAELDQKFANLVDLGFDPKDVRDVTHIYGYDPNTVVFILKDKAKTREKEKLKQKDRREEEKQKDSSSTSHEIPMQDAQIQLADKECVAYSEPDVPSNTADSSQDQDSHTEKCHLALDNSQSSVTCEILYKRNKDV